MPTPLNSRSRRDALFLWLVVVNLLPIFWFSRLPSADGPAHVYNASLFLRLGDAADPAWQFVEFNRSLPPNFVAHLLLALFTWLTSPVIAERLLLASYAVALPLALRYAMRGLSRETHGLEFVGLFLVFNQHFHWGFHNFLAGLVAYVFSVGFWLRIRGREFSRRSAAGVAMLAVVIYFCHPVPLVAFWLTLACLFVVDAVRTRTVRLAELRLAAVAVVPSVLLYLHYLATKPVAPSVSWEWSTPRFAASVLVRLYPLATYTGVERLAALALSCGLLTAAAWAFWTRASRRSQLTCLVTAGFFAVLVFIAPSQGAGGTMITPRLVYFPLFFVLLWLASVPWPARTPVVVIGVVVALTSVSHASRWPAYTRYEARLNEFLDSAGDRPASPVEMFYVVGQGTTVDLDSRSTPYLPAGVWGYVAAERRNVLLDYEPSLGYFPFSYKPNADPARFAARMPEGCYVSSGGLIDEASYREATGLAVATQVVWLYPDRPAERGCVREFGRRVATTRETPHGTLMWFDSED